MSRSKPFCSLVTFSVISLRSSSDSGRERKSSRTPSLTFCRASLYSAICSSLMSISFCTSEIDTMEESEGAPPVPPRPPPKPPNPPPRPPRPPGCWAAAVAVITATKQRTNKAKVARRRMIFSLLINDFCIDEPRKVGTHRSRNLQINLLP